MKRASIVKQSSLFALAVVACLAGGCGGSSKPPGARSGLLRPASAAELERAIKSDLTAIRVDAAVNVQAALGAGAVATTQPGAQTSFTGTYTQEPTVDEFDVVRYDGEHLYVAPQRYMTCCFVPAGAVSGVTRPLPRRTIRILATDPAAPAATPVSEIPLADGVSVQGMYISGGSMFALTSDAFYGVYGAFWADLGVWSQHFGFQVYDVRDAASPKTRFAARIDGVFVDSRRIGDTVYIVSRYSPRIDGLDLYVTTPEEQEHNAALLRNVPLGRLLPQIELNGMSRPLVDERSCYIARDAGSGEPGSAMITTIMAVPIDDPGAFRTVCYDEQAYGAYVSPTALYLTELRPDTAHRRTSTRIHKFALAGDALAYKGSAEIAGHVWRGGQADFRLSEHEGDLRAFTTEVRDWSSGDFVDHRLYVLRESPKELALDIVSELPNERHPEEIGKPNEQLYGVRFFLDRAYAVTYQRIDPLYVVDLSNPADPRLAGRLEISGVSDFLHPVTANLLLGLGSAAQGGIKLELFDVSDINRPLSRGSATLGARGSVSEAQYDRHAFTSQADVGGVDRFTIPAQLYGDDGRFLESGLYLYEIRDKGNVNVASLNSVGSLIAARAGGDPETQFAIRNRAFIHDDTIFYVRDDAVWAAFWNATLTPAGPF